MVSVLVVAKACACFPSISNEEVCCSLKNIPLRPEYKDCFDQLHDSSDSPRFHSATPTATPTVDQNFGKRHLCWLPHIHEHLLLFLCSIEHSVFCTSTACGSVYLPDLLGWRHVRVLEEFFGKPNKNRDIVPTWLPGLEMGKTTSVRIWECDNILFKIVFMRINKPKPLKK